MVDRRKTSTLVLALLCVLLTTIPGCGTAESGIALIAATPPMGWNSWNHFHCNRLSESMVKDTAEALVSKGLKAAGYVYVNLDDCWQIGRNASGHIMADPTRFPSGIAALADFMHDRGLKLGVYTDAGTLTCQRRPGSYRHERLDALTYASWGVDYVKNDDCYFYPPPKPLELYKRFWEGLQEGLNVSGRPIVHSVKSTLPIEVAHKYSNLRRVGTDIKDEWAVMLALLDVVLEEELWQYTKPGFWNDFDMLEIGNGGMTFDEYVAHFAIWVAFKAPLLLGSDIRNTSKEVIDLLTHDEMLKVLRDPLGLSVKPVSTHRSTGGTAQQEVISQTCDTDAPAQQWIYSSETGKYVNAFNNLCMTVVKQGVNNILVTAECDETNPRQSWTFNDTTNQLHLNGETAKCLTVSNYHTGQSMLRGCERRQSIFDWQGPNLWWHGFADAVTFLDGSTPGSKLIKVLNKNNVCAGVGASDELMTFAGKLSGDRWVVLLLNRDTVNQDITFSFGEVDGMEPDWTMTARDVYERLDLPDEFHGVFSSKVKGHYASLFILSRIIT